jgi:hypothetical protein
MLPVVKIPYPVTRIFCGSLCVMALPMICIRNLSRKTGLMNGTRGVIEKLLKHSVAVKVACGPSAGQIVFVPRINLQSTGQAKGFPLWVVPL